MTNFDKMFLKCLCCFMNGKKFTDSVDYNCLKQASEKAKEQKLLSVLYCAAEDSFKAVFPFDEYEKLQKNVFISTVSQMQRTAELVRVCRILESSGTDYIVFKGAVLRAMYKNSDYRISSDEDLLLRYCDISAAAELLCGNGYEIASDKGGEIKLVNRKLKSVLELHSSVAPDDLGRYSEINSALNSQLDSPVRLNIGTGEVNTFSPTYGFLSLCVHFYNHFVLSGIGIRQVMDIACFYKIYSDEIDFEYVFSLLEKIRAEKLIKSVLAIGAEYFEIDYHGENGVSEKLLEELFEAGIYGTSGADRVHSGALTAELAKKGSGTIGSLASTLFPSKESVVKNHPELEGKNSEINKYRFRRIVKFAGGGGKLKTFSYAEKRKKLLKELDIID